MTIEDLHTAALIVAAAITFDLVLAWNRWRFASHALLVAEVGCWTFVGDLNRGLGREWLAVASFAIALAALLVLWWRLVTGMRCDP